MSSKHEPEPVLLTNDWVGNLRNKRSRERAEYTLAVGGSLPKAVPCVAGRRPERARRSVDWVRRHSVREVNLELMEGRVVELSLEGTRPEGEERARRGRWSGSSSRCTPSTGCCSGRVTASRSTLPSPRETENLIEAITSLMEIGGVELVVSENEHGRTHFNSGARKQNEHAGESPVSSENRGGE